MTLQFFSVWKSMNNLHRSLRKSEVTLYVWAHLTGAFVDQFCAAFRLKLFSYSSLERGCNTALLLSPLCTFTSSPQQRNICASVCDFTSCRGTAEAQELNTQQERHIHTPRHAHTLNAVLPRLLCWFTGIPSLSCHVSFTTPSCWHSGRRLCPTVMTPRHSCWRREIRAA